MADRDLIAAREIVKSTLTPGSHTRCRCRDEIDAGQWDGGQKVRAALAGIKHGRGDGSAFECLAYDAHLPSMSVRFLAPEGFPIAGGIYRIERLRTATAEDTARWDRYAEPPGGEND